MRTIKLSVIVYISIITVIILGCGDESNPVANNPDPRIEGNSYYNPGLNFKVNTPEGWSLTKDVELGGYQLLLYGEQNSSSSYRSKFNIVAENIGSKLNMSDFLPIAKQNIRNMFSEVEFYSERVINTGGLECAELVCQLKQNDMLLKQRQLYFWSNQSIIVITFTSLSSLYVGVSNDFDFIQKSLQTLR